ncbi:MAG: transcriptional repressor NrdR [Candidatus Latescibacteria bacterium]|jgi:transcriptional repressor NrdR|nr:transcriptional repressor NrdR [Candidatus Latescibacterota bacterium]
MRCPFCGSDTDKVVDSRSSKNGQSIRRRRECLECNQRFTTYEYIEDVSLIVIKSDGSREPFSRKKLLVGMTISCAKRPISSDRLDEIADEIKQKLESRGEREVSSHDIGELIMEHLKKLDDVAYVRFASVYRKFSDTTEFLEELKNIQK